MYKKDFNASGTLATAADTITTSCRGAFTVGASGNNADFPLVYRSPANAVVRMVVKTSPP